VHLYHANQFVVMMMMMMIANTYIDWFVANHCLHAVGYISHSLIFTRFFTPCCTLDDIAVVYHPSHDFSTGSVFVQDIFSCCCIILLSAQYTSCCRFSFICVRTKEEGYGNFFENICANPSNLVHFGGEIHKYV